LRVTHGNILRDKLAVVVEGVARDDGSVLCVGRVDFPDESTLVVVDNCPLAGPLKFPARPRVYKSGLGGGGFGAG
jgi:hypothetical protein